MAGYARKKPLSPNDIFTSFNDVKNNLGGPMSSIASDAHDRLEAAARQRLGDTIAGSKLAGRTFDKREYYKQVYNPIFRRPKEIPPSAKDVLKVSLLDNDTLQTTSRSSRQTG